VRCQRDTRNENQRFYIFRPLFQNKYRHYVESCGDSFFEMDTTAQIKNFVNETRAMRTGKKQDRRKDHMVAKEYCCYTRPYSNIEAISVHTRCAITQAWRKRVSCWQCSGSRAGNARRNRSSARRATSYDPSSDLVFCLFSLRVSR